MNFKELYGRYQRGEATPEERALVEEELEKLRLLTEHLAGEEGPLPPLPPEPLEEGAYRRARRAAKRRAIRLVVIAAILACVLAVGGSAVYQEAVVPWLEREVYYDPTVKSYPELISLNDLSVAVAALSELTAPDWISAGVYVQRTGVGRYSIKVGGVNGFDGSSQPITGALDRGVFQFDNPLFSQTVFAFQYDTIPFENRHIAAPGEARASLEQLPEFVAARAAVSFGRDLSMEELAALVERHPDLHFGWVGIRAAPMDKQRLPLVGFWYHRSGYLLDMLNDQYPQFFRDGDAPADLEAHFKSLLRFVADNHELVDPLHGAPEGADNSYYSAYCRERLEYVEEHGAYTYGAYVTGAPEDLAALCGEEAVCGLNIEDLRLTVPD